MEYTINDKFKAKVDIHHNISGTIRVKKGDVCEIRKVEMGGITDSVYHLCNTTIINGDIFPISEEALDDAFEKVNDNFAYAMAVLT